MPTREADLEAYSGRKCGRLSVVERYKECDKRKRKEDIVTPINEKKLPGTSWVRFVVMKCIYY